MGNVMKGRGKALLSVGGVIVMVALAVWQFYVFVTFRELEGGAGHLWLAIGAATIACLAGFLVFSVFLRYDREDEMHITSSPARR